MACINRGHLWFGLLLSVVLFASAEAGKSQYLAPIPEMVDIPAPAIRMDGADMLGMGIVRPHLHAGNTLHFYNRPEDLTALSTGVTPVDSLVFGEERPYLTINYAPPWFVPEYMNLDYDALLLRAVSVSQNWLEVVVNAASPRPCSLPHTYWVTRQSVYFDYWPEFLLTVAAVEVLDADENPLRSAPDVESTTVKVSATALLFPRAIQGDWLQVSTAHGHEGGRIGWVRWRMEDQLAIMYSLTM